jgi:TetR/AcrR family transcriptional repressor of nem operon
MINQVDQEATTSDRAGTSLGSPATRERLLMAAMELFTTKGYEATSVAEILKRAGVNSGSLYYFFESKHELLVEGLEFFKTLLYPIVMQPAFARESDPIERIFAVLEDYRQRLLITDLNYECPVGKLALEVARHSPEARRRIAENFAAWRDHIRDCLDQTADRLPPSVDRNSLATFVLTTMEGAVMQARTHRHISYYDSSISHLRAYFVYLLSNESSS